MAVSPVTVKTRVSYPEPQMLVEFDWYHGTHIINADGTESWFYKTHIVVKLKKKVVVEESASRQIRRPTTPTRRTQAPSRSTARATSLSGLTPTTTPL